jgi:hypothetical protein
MEYENNFVECIGEARLRFIAQFVERAQECEQAVIDQYAFSP